MGVYLVGVNFFLKSTEPDRAGLGMARHSSQSKNKTGWAWFVFGAVLCFYFYKQLFWIKS